MPPQPVGVLHHYTRFLVRVLFKMYFSSCQVYGRDNVPPDSKPYLLAINHRSFLDPGVVWAYYPKPVFFLLKRELCKVPVFGDMFQRLGNISVNRSGASAQGVKQALNYLTEHKRSVAVFLEGTRAPTVDLERCKNGCALLARRAGVPVVPLYIHGTGFSLPKGHLIPRYTTFSLHIGSPLSMPKGGVDENPARDELENTTLRIRDAILALDPTCETEC